MNQPDNLDARITALHLEDGDIIAIQSQRKISIEQAEQLHEQIRRVVGDRPILILPPMLELLVVRYPLESNGTP